MSVRGPLWATPHGADLELAGASTGRARLGLRDSAVGTSRLALLGILGLLASGFAIAISAANTAPLLPESIRPVPPSLAGAFGSSGLNLHSGGTIVVLTLMLVSYAVVATAAGRLPARTVLMTIAALNALVLLAPPLVSTDIFSYQAYARMGSLFGTNPYLSGPHAIMLDPVFPYVGAKWSYIPSVYGPLFTVFSYLLAPVSIVTSVVAYKSIAVLASLGIVVLVWNAAPLRGVDPIKAVALVGLNPLLLIYGVGGGHNDLLMLLAMVGAIYAILLYRERLGGGLAVLGIGVKLTAGLLLPFAIAAGGPLRGPRRRRDLLLGAGVALALVISLSLAVFGASVINLFATVQHTQSEGDWHSIPGFIATRLGAPTIGHVVGYVLAAAFVAATVWLLRRVWRGQQDWIDGAGWATAAMLIAASSLLPWYVAWLLPLAALASDRRLVRTAIVLTCVVQAVQMLGYIPHGASPLGL
jgi:alpha-1,6-mannosyltransferase